MHYTCKMCYHPAPCYEISKKDPGGKYQISVLLWSFYYCSLYGFITITMSLTKYIKYIDHNCSVMVLCLFISLVPCLGV